MAEAARKTVMSDLERTLEAAEAQIEGSLGRFGTTITQSFSALEAQLDKLDTTMGRRVEEVGTHMTAGVAAVDHSTREQLAAVQDTLGQAQQAVQDAGKALTRSAEASFGQTTARIDALERHPTRPRKPRRDASPPAATAWGRRWRPLQIS